MEYKVDGWNNFCRVFEVPTKFSSEFCFGGGIPTNFQMVDWFNPVMDVPQPAVSKEVWKEKVGDIKVEIITSDYSQKLIPFLLEKRYVREGRKYLVLCDFGLAFTFSK